MGIDALYVGIGWGIALSGAGVCGFGILAGFALMGKWMK